VQVAKYILRPQLLAEIGSEMEDHQTMRRMWPPEARTPHFLQFIRDQYDQTQQAAIEVSHLVHDLRHVCRSLGSEDPVLCCCLMHEKRLLLHNAHDTSQVRLSSQALLNRLGIKIRNQPSGIATGAARTNGARVMTDMIDCFVCCCRLQHVTWASMLRPTWRTPAWPSCLLCSSRGRQVQPL